MKKTHELAVARSLVEALRRAGEDLGDPVPSEAPDAVCVSLVGSIGIEVADAFYDDAAAADAWAPARGRRPRRSVGFLNDDQALAERLNATLAAHCRKDYGMPTYFVVDVSHAVLTDTHDAPILAAELTIPAGCRFARVYLRMRDHASGRTVLLELRRPEADTPA